MKYLTTDYLYTHAFERAIAESTADFDRTIDNLESETIDLVKSYLSEYYDVNKIFSQATPIRNGVLSKIMTKIILYEAVRRNAYRKVAANYDEDYKWAMDSLEKLNSGRLKLNNLPPRINEDGKTDNSRLMWGNLSNKNNFI